jgi:hypothetical protein
MRTLVWRRPDKPRIDVARRIVRPGDRRADRSDLGAAVSARRYHARARRPPRLRVDLRRARLLRRVRVALLQHAARDAGRPAGRRAAYRHGDLQSASSGEFLLKPAGDTSPLCARARSTVFVLFVWFPPGALRSFRGDSGERSESPGAPPIRVRCPVGQGLPGAYEDHPWEATRQGERKDLRVPGERGQPDVARDHGEAPGFERGGSRRSRRRGHRLRPRQEGVG